MGFHIAIVFILMKFNASIFPFMDCISCVESKNSLPSPNSQIFLCFPKSFVILHFTFMLTIHFWLIFLWSMKFSCLCSSFWIWMSNCSRICQKDCYPPTIELFLYLCTIRNSTFLWVYFWVLYYASLLHVSISLPMPFQINHRIGLYI